MARAFGVHRLTVTVIVLFALFLSLAGVASAQDAPPVEEPTVETVIVEEESPPAGEEPGVDATVTDEAPADEGEEPVADATEDTTETTTEEPEVVEAPDAVETEDAESESIAIAEEPVASPEAVAPDSEGETDTATAAGAPAGSFTVIALDENDDPFTDEVCFTTFVDLGGGTLGDEVLGEFCNTPNDIGRLLNRSDPPGDYVLVVIGVPTGFGPPANTPFTVEVNQDTLVEIVIPVLDNPDEPGSLTVFKVDDQQDPLPGACFQLFTEVNDNVGDPVGDRVCDEDDGSDDGTIFFAEVAPGDYRVKEVRSPAGFPRRQGGDPVTIAAALNETITLSNVPGDDRATFILTAFTEDGDPLEDACFEVREDLGNGEPGDLVEGSSTLCSEANGDVLSRFENVGSYVVVVVTTPEGFETPANVVFEVFEREDTPVRVVFSPIQDPDPDPGPDPDPVDDVDPVDAGGDNETDDVLSLPSTGSGQDAASNLGLLLALGAIAGGAAFGLRRIAIRGA